MSLALLFHYLLLNMFRMLVHPSSGACDLLWIYFMCYIALVRCVLVLRCGSAGVVWYPYGGWSLHKEPDQYNTWNKFTISRKLLKMDVLTFETCWAVNSEIIKQVKSSWSIFIELNIVCIRLVSVLNIIGLDARYVRYEDISIKLIWLSTMIPVRTVLFPTVTLTQLSTQQIFNIYASL